jgi:hypothetical protein
LIDAPESPRAVTRISLAVLALLVAATLVACSARSATSSTPGAPTPATAAATVASQTPSAAQSAAIPAEYQDLYNQLQASIAASDRQISSAWDGSKYPVNYSAELISADSNGGFGILNATVRKVMGEELDAEASMGVGAITIQIGFPLLDPAFYVSLGQSSAQASQAVQTWIDYYSALSQAVHARNLKLIVEANPLLTYFTGSDTSLDASGYYKSLDFNTYQQRRSDHNILVAQKVRPDYLLLQTEPQTDAVNAQNRPLTDAMNDPKADADMIGGFVANLEAAAIPGLHTSIQLGAGMGTWQGNWQQYATNFAAIPGLDKIDCHIYNLQPGLDEIGAAERVADIAHAAGKGASIAEFWLHKSTTLSGLTANGDPLLDVRARDTFSFWEPLDEQFLGVMVKLANAKHFDYINAFGFYSWFTLVDYASLPAPCPPHYPASSAAENSVCDSKIQALRNNQASQALGSGDLSPLGLAYKKAIGH